MVFSSIPFLFFFLPFFLILYYIVPFSFKNVILLAFSLVFYAWGEPIYILLMLFEASFDFVNGLAMERWGTTKGKRRIFLITSLAVDLSFLFFFKYADFVISVINGAFSVQIPYSNIQLPIGISFFTFQTLSYTIDLYRKEVKAEHNYISYVTYVSMFPQLVAGPIVRFQTVQQELARRSITWVDSRDGLIRFLQGLFKKVLLANQIGEVYDEIRTLAYLEAPLAWLGIICFVLQIYFDFSAYSDMAIGMGRMLGFHFNENFNYPLSALSITDFWRRWHISLSSWFRDYVYIPLGGNRGRLSKQIRNILITWFLTGLWHGASWNYIIWGLYFGLLLLLEKYCLKKYLQRLPKVASHLYVLILVILGFVIFANEDMGEMGRFFTAMFSVEYSHGMAEQVLWYLQNNAVLLSAAVVLAFPLYPWLVGKCEGFSERGKTVLSLVTGVGRVALFVLATACLVSDSYNPFLYFRF